MHCDHRALFHVSRVVVQSLKYSWQTVPYTSATIATISNKGMFSFSSFTWSWPLCPMASSQKLELEPPFSTGKHVERESVQQYIQHVVLKDGTWGHHSGDKHISERREVGANQHHNHCNMRSSTSPFKRIWGHHEGDWAEYSTRQMSRISYFWPGWYSYVRLGAFYTIFSTKVILIFSQNLSLNFFLSDS